MRPLPRLRAALLLALLPAAALGHDFWIEPSSFHPPVPADLSLALRVGQNFQGEPVPRMDSRIVKFAAFSAEKERPVGGLPGADPAGLIRVEQPGLSIFVYRSNHAKLELTPEKFEQYLAEEGLERIVAERARRGESGKPSREVYSRSVKTLVFAGGGRSGSDRAVGLTLELVAEKSPEVLRPGQALPVRLLWEGRPLEGALVIALSRQDPSRKISGRTDRNGRVTLSLPTSGIWLVKSVHMVPAPPQTGADWESVWASMTFEVPESGK